MHLIRLRFGLWAVAVMLHVAASEMCSAETYSPIPLAIESSASRMVTALVQPKYDAESNRRQADVSVFTRFSVSRPPGLAYKHVPTSLHSGVVKSEVELKLQYEPAVVRVSDGHLALVDRHGVNRHWLRENPAIRILSLKDGDEIRIRVESLIPDITLSAFVSESTLGWFRDAWFSNDGKYFYVWLRKAKTANDHDMLCAVNVNDGSIGFIEPSNIKDVFDQSEERFYASLFDIAVYQGNRSLGELARAAWKNSKLSLNVRVHAAAYLFWHSRDQEAFGFIRSVAGLMEAATNEQAPVDVNVNVIYEDDPITFALNVIRLNQKAQTRRLDTRDRESCLGVTDPVQKYPTVTESTDENGP